MPETGAPPVIRGKDGEVITRGEELAGGLGAGKETPHIWVREARIQRVLLKGCYNMVAFFTECNYTPVSTSCGHTNVMTTFPM